jgi:hypothetical protein
MKRPYTNKELFSIINSRLKDANLLPDILDYGLEATDEVAIRSYHWDTIGIVNFGGSEGIYLDIYAWGNVTQEDKQEKIKLATYKTLSEKWMQKTFNALKGVLDEQQYIRYLKMMGKGKEYKKGKDGLYYLKEDLKKKKK